MPLFLPIVLSVLGGIIVASIVLYASNWSVNSELKKTRKQIKLLEDEVQRLHNLPLATQDDQNTTNTDEDNKENKDI
jgi:type II secretory pathway pseudopilin PulG